MILIMIASGPSTEKKQPEAEYISKNKGNDIITQYTRRTYYNALKFLDEGSTSSSQSNLKKRGNRQRKLSASSQESNGESRFFL